eukprot:CFRG5017T1
MSTSMTSDEYNTFMFVFEMIATTSYALAGALAGARDGCDVVGMTVFALVTACGGGTLRDLIIYQPVFWAADALFIYISFGAMSCIYIYTLFKPAETFPRFYLMCVESIGLGSFAVIGTSKTLEHGFPIVTCVFLGVLTGTGGGILRDTLSGRVAIVFQQDLICMSSLFGCVIFALTSNYEPNMSETWYYVLSTCTITLIAGVRILGSLYPQFLPRPRRYIRMFLDKYHLVDWSDEKEVNFGKNSAMGLSGEEDAGELEREGGVHFDVDVEGQIRKHHSMDSRIEKERDSVFSRVYTSYVDEGMWDNRLRENIACEHMVATEDALTYSNIQRQLAFMGPQEVAKRLSVISSQQRKRSSMANVSGTSGSTRVSEGAISRHYSSGGMSRQYSQKRMSRQHSAGVEGKPGKGEHGNDFEKRSPKVSERDGLGVTHAENEKNCSHGRTSLGSQRTIKHLHAEKHTPGTEPLSAFSTESTQSSTDCSSSSNSSDFNVHDEIDRSSTASYQSAVEQELAADGIFKDTCTSVASISTTSRTNVDVLSHPQSLTQSHTQSPENSNTHTVVPHSTITDPFHTPRTVHKPSLLHSVFNFNEVENIDSVVPGNVDTDGEKVGESGIYK